MCDVSRGERLIAYIDGFNLYHGLHDQAHCKYLWLDVVELVRRMRPAADLTKVYYFTSSVLDDPPAASRQAHHIDAMKRKHPDVLQVVQGRYQRKTRKCHNCELEYVTYEEKETDVNIAVQLVSDALQGNMDMALIISADSDMAPAIRTVRRLNSTVTLVAAFPPNRHSNELKSLLPSSFSIGENKIRQSQLPDQFTVDGIQFRRPAEWVHDPTWTSPRKRRARQHGQ
ncbi:NYN domain-containing protein [Schaalia sp. 19OD2882]|uniref:NYN domain-containing protein n=1 Tax=Schaalia sp. 19OD2882 TaxID=2794089 RepID=UPI001C1EC467|nr:NYN domain-containing protein [Schaalia sp. 19OD2882]QWW20036.1 NYN domain-containing protein [Schaalia sp. 19OD2882]